MVTRNELSDSSNNKDEESRRLLDDNDNDEDNHQVKRGEVYKDSDEDGDGNEDKDEEYKQSVGGFRGMLEKEAQAAGMASIYKNARARNNTGNNKLQRKTMPQLPLERMATQRVVTGGK